MDGVRAVGITSRTLSKAKKLADISQIEQVYDTFDHLLEGCAPDGVMILVSANQIYDVAINLLPTGIPLFLEKPPGLYPEQTSALVKLADQYGTQTMVGFNRRYYSVFRKGLEVINNRGGLLGLAVEGHERFWKIAGRDIPDEIRQNWICANSTHTIDLLRLFGGEVKTINALSNSLKETNGDQFVASMKFASGAIGTYTSHWFSPGGWCVTLYGYGITVKFNPLEKGIWINTDFKENEIIPDEVDIKYKPGFYRQMETFLHLIRDGKMLPPALDLNGANKTMLLAKKISHA